MATSPGEGCRDVQFLFVRGSGAAREVNAEYGSFRDSIARNLAESDLSYEVNDLEYPAVAVDNFSVLTTAFISAGHSGEFADSVATGATNFSRYYQETYAACPATKWVLFGYSQGARVLASVLHRLRPDNIVYVGMFGDPNLYLPEGVGFNPPACQGRDLSIYRRYVPNCDTDSGIFGVRKPYVIGGLEDKIGLWCNDDDLICGSSKNLFSNSGHTRYMEYAGIPAAVDLAVRRVQQVFPEKVVVVEADKPVAMDTVFLIDATGSMSGRLLNYRTEAMRLAGVTVGSGGRIALFSYRDLAADGFGPVRLCDFGCSLSEFEEKLNRITVFGGGDAPESLLNASLGALNTLSWQAGATKSIVVLTDDVYHDPDHDGTTLEDVARRCLEIDPVNIYVVTGEHLRDDYAGLAELTGGKVFGFGEMGASTDYIAARPVVVLPQGGYFGVVGDSFRFDASGSYALDFGVERFDWDLDGDGVFELVDGGAVVERVYGAVAEHFVVVRVVDGSGASSTMSAWLSVAEGNDADDLLAAPGNFRVVSESAAGVRLGWRNAVGADYNLLVVDGVVVGLVPGEVEEVTLSDIDVLMSHIFVLTSLDEDYDIGGSVTLVTESEKLYESVMEIPEMFAPSSGQK